MTDQDVLEYFNKWKYVPWKRVDDKYKEYLIHRFQDVNIYGDSRTYIECLYRLRNHIEKIPTCPICGRPVKSYIYKFAMSCGSVKCAPKMQHRSYIKNLHKKYGNSIDNCSQLEEVKRKIADTCLKRYGSTSPLANKDIWTLARKHTIEKYGSAYNKKKYNETMVSRYGVRWFTQSNKMIQLAKNSELRYKGFSTMKKNGTLNSSKLEDLAYQLILEKYPDVRRQFRSERYPFNCDFYIPSLDLYIECQFGQFHHHRPYTGNETDLKEVEDLRRRSDHIKEKTGKQRTRYDSEIETWTVRDVKKRECAKKNNLNYVEFWTILKLEDWINKNYDTKK